MTSFFAPEVLQTSSVDCGPACLRSILLGFGVDSSYEQVRTACGTGVGGSSLARIEAAAKQHGIAAEQVWIPVDHLTLTHRRVFPAIGVSQPPGSSPHFTVVWRRVGPWYQVMDPNSGRRWVDAEGLRSINHSYHLDIPADRWLAWVQSEDYAGAIAERLAEVGATSRLYACWRSDPNASVADFCGFDAAVRMVGVLVRKGTVRPGRMAVSLIRELWTQARLDALAGKPTATIPEEFYGGVPNAELTSVRLAGAVVLRFRGVAQPALEGSADRSVHRRWEAPRSTAQIVREAMAPAGRAKTMLALFLAGIGALSSYIVAFLVRAYTSADGAVLGLDARLAFVGLVVAVLTTTAAVDLWWTLQIRSLGRLLDVRLRQAFVERLSALRRSFLRSRPASDVAHRVHLATFVRNIPETIGQGWSTLCSLLLATAALLYLFPEGRWAVLGTLVAAIAVPALAHRRLVEKDGKLRAQNSRLAQFNLDALMGAKTVAAHGARHALRWSHGRIVDSWAAAARERLRILVSVEFVMHVVSNGSAVAIVWSYATRPEMSPAILLVAFWSLAIPRLSESLLATARALPTQRTVLHRLVEPIAAGDAPTEPIALPESPPPLGIPAYVQQQSTQVALVSSPPPVVHLRRLRGHGDRGDTIVADATAMRDNALRISNLVWRNVSFHADEHCVLHGIDLFIPSGSHVAIVGPSGAGKSTLLSLALGWNSPTRGSVLLDGREATAQELRDRVGWLDPEVALWDESLLENIRYGSSKVDTNLADAVGGAGLHDVLARRPQGYHTRAGEGGRRLSGGEGQRVRLARMLSNGRDADILVLDEPFRGLSRDAREAAMHDVRERWRDRTILCATHDIETACRFDRVLVVEGGTIVEDGDPRALLESASALRRLLDAERDAFDEIWNAPIWRQLRLHGGRLHEAPAIRKGA